MLPSNILNRITVLRLEPRASHMIGKHAAMPVFSLLIALEQDLTKLVSLALHLLCGLG